MEGLSWEYGKEEGGGYLLKVYDRSPIFDIRPKPKTSIQKLGLQTKTKAEATKLFHFILDLSSSKSL